MVILNFLWQWFIANLAQTECQLTGHKDVQVIEHHSTECVIKDFRGGDPKKLRRMKNHLATKIKGKIRCRTCGEVFIGKVTVKDAHG
jgi:hypothetical protein